MNYFSVKNLLFKIFGYSFNRIMNLLNTIIE